MWHSQIPEWSKQQGERSRAGREQRILEYGLNPSKCGYCESSLPYDKRHSKFCNNSCAASSNNVGNRKHGQDPGGCKVCGKKLPYSKRDHCSRECAKVTAGKRKEERYQKFIQDWLAGLKNGQCGESVCSHIKRYLFEKHNSKCQTCGWGCVNPVTGKIPLTIHHDNGDWKDNRPSNLKLLCPNCHSLTPTYGSKNRGNGRVTRRVKRHAAMVFNGPASLTASQ